MTTSSIKNCNNNVNKFYHCKTCVTNLFKSVKSDKVFLLCKEHYLLEMYYLFLVIKCIYCVKSIICCQKSIICFFVLKCLYCVKSGIKNKNM